MLHLLRLIWCEYIDIFHSLSANCWHSSCLLDSNKNYYLSWTNRYKLNKCMSWHNIYQLRHQQVVIIIEIQPSVCYLCLPVLDFKWNPFFLCVSLFWHRTLAVYECLAIESCAMDQKKTHACSILIYWTSWESGWTNRLKKKGGNTALTMKQMAQHEREKEAASEAAIVAVT